MKLCPIKTNFETTISKSINHTEFVYCWQETFLLDLLWQIFSCHFMKSNSLSSAQKNLNQFFTEDMLMTVLFSLNRLSTSGNLVITLILVFQTCLSPLNRRKMESCHFWYRSISGKRKIFFDIEVSLEKGKSVTTVYGKPTFSGMYTHFESFLPIIYKFLIVYTLVYRCFKICSD